MMKNSAFFPAISRSINEDENLEPILEEFIKQDIYIIIGIFDVNTTVRLYCQIYKKQMYGENYQWILLGTSLNNLKKYYFNQNTSYCTYNELLESLNGTLQTRITQYSYDYYKKSNNFIQNFDKHNRRDALMKNITDSYMKSYFKECSANNTLCFHSACFHGYAFDLFLTIFNLIGSLIESKQFLCDYETFERNQNWFKIVNEGLNNISFTGVTVLILVPFFYSQVFHF